MSLFLSDLSVTIVAKIGTLNFYAGDIVVVLIFITAIRILKNKPIIKILTEQKFLLLVTSIFFISMAIGLNRFGARAIGEGRYFYFFFAFVIPLYFYSKNKYYNLEDFEDIFKKTIFITGFAAIALFIIEIIYGGRFFLGAANQNILQLEDFRGTRYLGSEDTYNLTVLWLLVFFTIVYEKRNKYLNIVYLVLLLSIIIFTKNRAAPVSLFITLIIVYSIFEKRIKPILAGLVIIMIALIILKFTLPQYFANILYSFEGVINFREDNTGSWRFYVQYSALTQGLEKPILGEGYGGYFAFYVPEFHKTVDLPPHNIFIFLFLKSGLIGVISSILLLTSLSYQAISLKKLTQANPIYEKYRIIFLTVFISQFFYGIAYGFSIYLGLFIGFFLVYKTIIYKGLYVGEHNGV